MPSYALANQDATATSYDGGVPERQRRERAALLASVQPPAATAASTAS